MEARRAWRLHVSFHLVTLVAAFIAAMIVYNITNILDSQWFKHPDETGVYLVGKRLVQDGVMTFPAQLNERYDTSAFTPAGLRFYEGENVPYKAYGDYLLTGLSFLFSENGPFVLVTFAAGVAMLALYGTISRFFGPTAGVVGGMLFGFSFPVMFWAQSLYGNLPALAFFSLGIWLLSGLTCEQRSMLSSGGWIAKVLRAGWRPSLIGLLFGLASIIRYEYAIITAVFMLVLLILDKRWWKTLLAVSGAAGLMAIWPFVVNAWIFGHPLRFAYTFDLPGRVLGASEREESAGFVALFDRFFRHDVMPDLSRIFTNWVDWVWGLAPVLVLLGSVGLLAVWKRRSQGRALFLALSVAMTLWTYDTLGGFHWGEGMNIRSAVYGRYLLPLYYLLAALAAIAVAVAATHVQRWSAKFGLEGLRKCVPVLLGGLVVSVATANGLWLLFTGSGSLQDDLDQRRLFKEINAAAAQLPEDAIVVSNLYNKAIIARPVLDYYLGIPGTVDEKRLEAMRIMSWAFSDGRSVYVLEAKWHTPSYASLENRMVSPEDPRFEVQPIMIDGIRFLKVVESLWSPDQTVEEEKGETTPSSPS